MAVIIAPVRRLLPTPADPISVAEAYGVSRPRPVDRPWLGLCMVAGLDGSTVVDDNSRALSSDADRDVLLGLRAIADLLLVGASTVRIEGYGPPSKPGQRVGVVSRTGDLDLTTELFRSGGGFLVVPESAPDLPVDTVRAGSTELDLAGALRQIGQRFDVDYVQAEGGPALNAALVAADLLDELDLTVSPVISGGDGPRLTTGAPDVLRRMQLAHLCEDDGFLFTRYVRPD
jgi:riboflavin biosynthesis pyrimidine reductase